MWVQITSARRPMLETAVSMRLANHTMVLFGILYIAVFSCFSQGLADKSVTSPENEITSPLANFTREEASENSKCINVSLTKIVTQANLTWIIYPANSVESNIFAVHKPLPSCKRNELVFYDLDEDSGNRSFIADACSVSEDSFAGMSGRPTLVFYTPLSSEDEDNNLTFCYFSHQFTQAVCPQKDFLTLNATTSHQTISSFDSIRGPNNIVCSWEIPVPEKSVLNVLISKRRSPTGNNRNCSDSQDSLVVIKESISQYNKTMELVTHTIALCEDEIDIVETSLVTNVYVGYVSDDYGGASPVTFTYWIESACPTTTTELQAMPGHQKAFKGINRDVGTTDARNCTWNITAPEGMVVRLTLIRNMDYLLQFHTDDYLTLNGERPIALSDSHSFPYWSYSNNLLIDFHTPAGSETREFIMAYIAMPWAVCQARALVVVADTHALTIPLPALSANDTSGSWDCRMHVLPNQKDEGLRITVTSLRRPSSNSEKDVCLFQCNAYRGYDISLYALIPSHPSAKENGSIEYTSDGSPILFVFKREPGDPEDGINVTVVTIDEKNVNPTNCAWLIWMPPLLPYAAAIVVLVSGCFLWPATWN